ncbi:hypothetical protein HDU76_002523 [Blyttiomyces sp. JEL0837]|nr:hypothetical protein HDU76_002523 [Blyttiomyces sp. JEL0837]
MSNLDTAPLTVQSAPSTPASTPIRADDENAYCSTRTSTSTSPASTVVAETYPDQPHDDHLNKDDDAIDNTALPKATTYVDSTDSPTVVESYVGEPTPVKLGTPKSSTFKFNPNAVEFVPDALKSNAPGEKIAYFLLRKDSRVQTNVE